MSINGAIKVGWFLVGLGVGVFSTTMLMKNELEKPIGEIEEYIPLEDRISNSENESETSSNRNKNSRADSENKSYVQKDISERRTQRHRNERSGRHNDQEENYIEFLSYNTPILDYYRSSSKDATRTQNKSKQNTDETNTEREKEQNKKRTKYSRMYQEEAVEEALHEENARRGSRNSYDIIRDDQSESYETDNPMDDDYSVSPIYDADLHDKYTLERVEENIEIFLDDNPQDFITLIFYEGDNTLCDDGEQIVPNAEEVVGLTALSRLIEGGPGAENGVIFVHNLKTSLNYEVVLDAGSYQDTVVGQFESHLNKDGGIGGYS